MSAEIPEKKRIAILGGSFNPMHKGHAAMLDAARKTINPHELWLMPAKKPPHKPSYSYASDEDRVNMLKAFAADYPDVKVEELELKLEGFTYTSVTLGILTEQNPDCEFYFIIGGDSILNFHNWYHAEEIVKKAVIAICIRNDVDRDAALGIIRDLKADIGGEYLLLDFTPVEISSTDLREMLDSGKDVNDMIPARIYDYIKSHHLYGIDDDIAQKGPDLAFLMGEMKKSLKPSRYDHSLGVMETAKNLAMRYSVDVKKAEIAGILHDCAKYLSPEELVNLCRQNGVDLSESELADDTTKSSLLHSKAGMILAKNLYNIQDRDILNSIFYHTVGRPGMSMLEKIIFVADFIEPARKQKCDPPLEEMRKIAAENIDKAVYLICRSTVNYLTASGRQIDPATTGTLEYYKKLSQ